MYEALASRACEKLELAFPPMEVALPDSPMILLDRGDHIDAFVDGSKFYQLTLTGTGVGISSQPMPNVCGVVTWEPMAASQGLFGALCNPAHAGDPLTFQVYDASYNLLHAIVVGDGMTRTVVGGASSWLVAWAENGFEGYQDVPTGVATIDTYGQILQGPVDAPAYFHPFSTACGFVAIAGTYGSIGFQNQSDFDTPAGAFTTFETTADDSQLFAGVAWPYDGESVVLFDTSGGPPYASTAKPSLALVSRRGVRHLPVEPAVGGMMLATPLGLTFVGGSDATASLTATTVRPDGTTAASITMFDNGAPEAMVDMSTVWSQRTLLVFWSMYDPGPRRTLVVGVRCAE